MGTWVGGLFTTIGLKLVSMKGASISIISPGNKVPEIIQSIETCVENANWDECILFGYPPFLKAMLQDEHLQEQKTSSSSFWTKHFKKVSMVFAGEVFSEEWRTAIASEISVMPDDIPVSFCSMYGTADAAVIAIETPLSIEIRRFMSEKPEVAARIFGKSRLPTLCQYSPNIKFLESVRTPDDLTNSLVITSIPFGYPRSQSFGVRTLPTLRYEIGDDGGIIDFYELMREMEKEGFKPHHNYTTLPFVWVFGRKFWTLSLYGANVYVENIMAAVESPIFADKITGKFVIYRHQNSYDERLGVIVEMSKPLTAQRRQSENLLTLASDLASHICKEICRLNNEYKNYLPQEKQLPYVLLKPFGDAEYFPAGVKHNYVRSV